MTSVPTTTLLGVTLLLLTASCLAADQYVAVTCMSNTPPCTYKLSPTPFTPPSTAIAAGSFVDGGDDPSSGWGKVEVVSSSGGVSARDGIAAYAAGFAEGLMTAERIGQLWTNFMPGQFGPKGPSPHLFPYINTSLHYALDMGKVDYANPSSDGEWQYNAQLGLVMNQVQGVADGYAQARGPGAPVLDLLDIVVLNSIGDLDDLVPAMRVLYPETDGRGFASHGVDLSPKRLAEIESGGHCSLFIKPMPGQGLVAAHEMWASFWQMTLMYKSVELDVTLESTLAKTVTYSSYPAMVSSEDDFYLTSAGLQVMETTNSVLNVSIYDVIQPQSLLSWMRVVMANRMTDSGPAWADVFQAHNSGTYNNMWVITNHNIVPLDAVDLPPHSVTIASQMPGVVRVMDVTPIIASQGYFPSYNVPLIPELFDLAGYPAAVKEYGNVWSYGQNPRAHIFRTKAPSVMSLEDVRTLMRYNDYTQDPFSLGCPVFGLAARADLAPPHAKLEWGGICGSQAFGAINGKVSSSNLALNAKPGAYIIAGPTHSSAATPAFSWSASKFDNVSHVGQPDLFDFDWVQMSGAQQLQ